METFDVRREELTQSARRLLGKSDALDPAERAQQLLKPSDDPIVDRAIQLLGKTSSDVQSTDQTEPISPQVDQGIQEVKDTINIGASMLAWLPVQIAKWGEIGVQAARPLIGLPGLSQEEILQRGRNLEQKLFSFIPEPVSDKGKYLAEKMHDEISPVLNVAHKAADNVPDNWSLAKEFTYFLGDLVGFGMIGGGAHSYKMLLDQAHAARFMKEVRKGDTHALNNATSIALDALGELNIKPDAIKDPVTRTEAALAHVEKRTADFKRAQDEALGERSRVGDLKRNLEGRIIDEKPEMPGISRKPAASQPLRSGKPAKTARQIMEEQAGMEAGKAEPLPDVPEPTTSVYQLRLKDQPKSNWFFDTIDAVHDFANSLSSEQLKNSVIDTLDIPIAQLDSYRVSNLPKEHPAVKRGKGAVDELYVPDNIKKQARPSDIKPEPTLPPFVQPLKEALELFEGKKDADLLKGSDESSSIQSMKKGEVASLKEVSSVVKEGSSKILKVDLDRLPDWVEQKLEPYYKKMKSGDLKRHQRLHKIAVELLDYGEIKDPGLAKTFRKWYNKNRLADKQQMALEEYKISEKLKAQQEADAAKGLTRVDPETGREPGMHVPERRKPEPDEVTLAAMYGKKKTKKEVQEQAAADKLMKDLWEGQLKAEGLEAEPIDRRGEAEFVPLDEVGGFHLLDNERGELNLDFSEVRKGIERGLAGAKEYIRDFRRENGKKDLPDGPLKLRDLTAKEQQNLRRVIVEADKEKTTVTDYLMQKHGLDKDTASILERYAWASKVPDQLKRAEVRMGEKKGTQEGQRFVQSLNEATQRHKNLDELQAFNQFLRETGRLVDDYKVGSMQSPNYMKPQISTNMPQTRPGVVDLKDTGQSPHYITDKLFDVKNSPAIDYNEAVMSYYRNVQNHKNWIKDMTREVPSAAKAIDKAMLPAVEKIQSKIKYLDEALRELRHQEKLSKIEGSKADKKKLKKVKQRVSGLKHRINETLVEHFDKIIPDLAKTQPSVRIVLHAAGELPDGIKISMREWEVSDQLKKYFEKAKVELDAVGIKTKEGSYMPGLWQAMIGKDNKLVDKLFSKKPKVPTILSFKHKIPNSRTWFPDLKTILETYNPMVSRKLAFQPFLNRWKYPMDVSLPPNARKFMNKWFDKNYYGKELTWPDRIANAAIAWEYFRLIGFSPSVAYKHALKLSGTASIYGPLATLKSVPSVAKVPIQKAMKTLGRQGRTAELELFSSYVNLHVLTKMLDETPGMVGMMDLAKTIAASPTQMIECFDNGVSVMSGIMKGMKKDVPMETIHREVVQTILDANFRSGADAPLAYKNTWVRAATMFLMTPFKLAELKWKLIKDAAKDPFGKDNFGTTNGRKLLNMALIIGAAEGIARLNDTTTLEQFLHLPGASHLFGGKSKFPYVELHDPQIHGSPLIQTIANQSAAKSMAERIPGFKYLLDDPDKYQPVFPQIEKFRKLAKGKYNRHYYNSPIGYTFGIYKLNAGRKKKNSQGFKGFSSFGNLGSSFAN